MNKALSPHLHQYLVDCGLSKRAIARCNLDTRLWHDLGIFGDIAEAYLEVLVRDYRVDLTGFEFGKYFPPEFAERNVLARLTLWAIPLVGAMDRRRGRYMPFTLGMIEQVLQSKRWTTV